MSAVSQPKPPPNLTKTHPKTTPALNNRGGAGPTLGIGSFGGEDQPVNRPTDAPETILRELRFKRPETDPGVFGKMCRRGLPQGRSKRESASDGPKRMPKVLSYMCSKRTDKGGRPSHWNLGTGSHDLGEAQTPPQLPPPCVFPGVAFCDPQCLATGEATATAKQQQQSSNGNSNNNRKATVGGITGVVGGMLSHDD